jgi:signal transduction histidine kinase
VARCACSYTRNEPIWGYGVTTPSYTASSSSTSEVIESPAVPASLDALRRTGWTHAWHRALGVARSPAAVRAMLDAAAFAFIIAAFTQTALSAEFLFHCVFVLLVLHAFLFGLRGTLVRIALTSIPLLVYAKALSFGLNEPPLELTEWPLMFVIAALVAWMADRLNSNSLRYAALFRRASERLLTVEADERRRIAGNLHDGVGQVLTALTLTLDAAAADPDSRVRRRRIASARALAETALAETRDLAHRIRPTRVEERGLVAAVRDLATHSGFQVDLSADADLRERGLLGPTATVELYRIIQEALANAARHSGAERAAVSMAVDGDRLTVEIADAGEGFDSSVSRATGIGLAGMHERARLLGGRLTVDSAVRAGTRVMISVPLAAPPPGDLA